MNYPIVIEHEPGKAYGVQVPDLPGCFSAGDTLDEAISNAAEALAFHIEGLLDAGEKIPPPQAIESHSANPDYAGMIWAITSVDLAALSGKSKRLNISLPSASCAASMLRPEKTGSPAPASSHALRWRRSEIARRLPNHRNEQPFTTV